MAVKSQEYLKKIIREMKFGQEKTMPMAQGYAINEVIKRYKIPAKAWGYSGSAIGVETNKQKILWRDKGTHLDFLGIVNKELEEIKKK
jgi:hypothetical protein